MSQPIHPRLSALFLFADTLESLAKELAREANKRVAAKRPRVRRGATLRPGAETPLWNAVVEMARPLLRLRGSQAILARELGVHRARVGEFFRDGSAMPDAERALRLLVLLARTARMPDAGASPTDVRNTNIGPEAD